MRKGYRVIFEAMDMDNPAETLKRTTLFEEEVTPPTNCLDFSLAHDKQIQLLQILLDSILSEKTALINSHMTSCPHCEGEIIKLGKRQSTFHDVLTDHEVTMQRARCNRCGYEPPSTVRTFLQGKVTSGELAKIQAELGSQYTFRDAEEIFEKFSTKTRKINNHNRIKLTAEGVGTALKEINDEEISMAKIDEAKELILNVDGGHIKSNDPNVRSFEAMTAVFYQPKALKSNTLGTRHYLSSKSCAASALENREAMISNTIIAAIKEGMTPNTHITALCDGAQNCWNIVESLKPLCQDMTQILDWFHLSMKMENVSLPETIKPKFLRIKWHLWRGNVSLALVRLTQLKEKTTDKITKKITQFIKYVENNRDKIVNYRHRKKLGLVFTSNLAESTVESLINQRCKGQQHMKWSREGLEPILQLRAHLHSSKWKSKWKMAVLAAL